MRRSRKFCSGMVCVCVCVCVCVSVCVGVCVWGGGVVVHIQYSDDVFFLLSYFTEGRGCPY